MDGFRIHNYQREKIVLLSEVVTNGYSDSVVEKLQGTSILIALNEDIKLSDNKNLKINYETKYFFKIKTNWLQ